MKEDLSKKEVTFQISKHKFLFHMHFNSDP